MTTGACPPRLRPWRLDDSGAVLAAFAHADVARQAWSPVTTEAEAAEWLTRRIEDVERDASFAIDVDGRAVGGVRLSSIDRSQRTAWIGYWLAPKARGRGLASASVATLAEWAFGDLGLERIDLAHRVNNPASAAVALRAGFVAEGVQRAKLRHEGIRYDVATYGRLESDPVPADLSRMAIELPVDAPGADRPRAGTSPA
ncbi:MAG: acetyltransferase [Thermoleophilia bacterium]|nr:acetyltransferase [Thermoleophilia bacterium]